MLGQSAAAARSRRPARSASVRRRAPRRPDVSGDPGVARGARVRQHRALGDALVVRQRGLDLAELDPEAPDLDLIVDPAGEHQSAVAQPARLIAGPIEAAGAERARREALAGQLGAVQVPARDARTAAVELAVDACGHRVTDGVEQVELKVAGAGPIGLFSASASRAPSGR